MSTAIETEQWVSVQSSEVLEKRTYKSGMVRYYVKGYKTWGQVERYWAEKHWLAKKWFVKQDEYDEIKRNEEKRTMNKCWLIQAQLIGGIAPLWERK